MYRTIKFILIGVLMNALSFDSAAAQEPQFQLEDDTIPLLINGITISRPFTGGLTFSKPAFADIDADGDLDLFVGNGFFAGNISFYRNTGTSMNPAFVLETKNFLFTNTEYCCMAPVFVDIDTDGDLDLFVGMGDHISFYQNTGTATTPNFILETTDVSSISFGGLAVPAFADIDNDGDLDLFVGSDSGNISFFRNTGNTREPQFTLITFGFAQINVGDESVPFFADIDNDEDLDLFIGEFDGNINFYRNMGTVQQPDFILETENFADIDIGIESAPAFADIDDDGDLDLFVGEFFGNVNFYRNEMTATNPEFKLTTENFVSNDIGFESNPTFADIDNDGDLDLFVGEGFSTTGRLFFYRNTGTVTDPSFVFESVLLESTGFGSCCSAPAFADIDNDGDLDLFLGEGAGNISFYRNVGTAAEHDFLLETTTIDAIDIGRLSYPTFVDIDNDADFDLFVGEANGNLNFYRNTGTVTEAVFTLVTENVASIDVGFISKPTFADLDNDGDFDLFVGEENGNLNFYRNLGTVTNPNFTFETANFASINVGDDSAPVFVDIDNDSDLDLFVGEFEGGLFFYRNKMFTSVSVSESSDLQTTFELSQNYPNPFNPETSIRYELTKSSSVVLQVFDVLGRKVRVLVNEVKPAGLHEVKWDGLNDAGHPVSSGLYLYRIVSQNQVVIRKMVLMR